MARNVEELARREEQLQRRVADLELKVQELTAIAEVASDESRARLDEFYQLQGAHKRLKSEHRKTVRRQELLRQVLRAATIYNERSHHVDKCNIRYATTRPDAWCDCGKHELTKAIQALAPRFEPIEKERA